jgi:hypothetical protein
MEVTPLAVIDVGEIERGIAAFARTSDGGLVVPVSASAVRLREAIIASAARSCPRFTAIATSSPPAA